MFLKPTEVVVLCWDAPATPDRRALKIAEFLGVDATLVCISAVASSDLASIAECVPKCTCLIVHADTLAMIARTLEARGNGLAVLNSLAPYVFIFGFSATRGCDDVLRDVSGGRLRVQPLPDNNAKFCVPDGHREWCGHFSGLFVGAVDPGMDSFFVEGAASPEYDVMIQASGKPFFVRSQQPRAQVFFLACRELADLDEAVGPKASLSSWFSRLVPLMMFLRGALGKRVWHNDRPQACFIIDDPLLKDHYGFLDYRRLVESVKEQEFSPCIAFIPWNYRRSSKKVTEFLSSNYPRPYLCVHGCDHTAGEFAATNLESLCSKARVALDRMETHRQLSGAAFNDVMVFPQGRFSEQAMLALRSSGYLAAINTSVFPSAGSADLTLRDLLQVAVTKFANFPLFGRRYPGDIAEFAFDLFMGKPALVVVHHAYFQDGYDALANLVAGINALDDGPKWADLGTICSRACLTKTCDSGDVHVRFYTNRFQITNDGTNRRDYVLFRQITTERPLPSVLVNGHPSPCEQEDSQVRIRLSLDAGGTADVRIVAGESESATLAHNRTAIYACKVLARRILCEFRDNYVEPNRFLSTLLSVTRKVRTGPSPIDPLFQISRSTAEKGEL